MSNTEIEAPGINRRALRAQGMAAFKAGDHETALGIYQQVVATQDPDDASKKVLTDRGVLASILAKMGRNAEAARELAIVAHVDPADLSAQVKLAKLYLRMNKPDMVLLHLRRIAELAPQDAENHWKLADAAHDAGLDEEALAALEACLALEPDHALGQAAHKKWTAPPGPIAEPTDAAFVSISNFVQERAATDAGILPPVVVKPATFLPFIAICVGAVIFLAAYLFVRVEMLGG